MTMDAPDDTQFGRWLRSSSLLRDHPQRSSVVVRDDAICPDRHDPCMRIGLIGLKRMEAKMLRRLLQAGLRFGDGGHCEKGK